MQYATGNVELRSTIVKNVEAKLLDAKTFEQYRDISHRMFRDFAGKNSSSVASSAEGHVHRGTSSWGYASAVVSIAVLSRFIEYGLVPRLKKWVATPQSISASQEQFENVARATSRLLVAAPIPYLTLASTWSEISGDISASLRILGTGNEASEQELFAVASRLSFKVAQAAVKLLLYTEEQLESDILEAACAQDRLQEDGSSMSETASSRDNSQDHTERSGRSGSDAGSIISVGSSHGSNSLEDMLHRIRIARRASEASKAAAHDAETLALSEKGFDEITACPLLLIPERARDGDLSTVLPAKFRRSSAKPGIDLIPGMVRLAPCHPYLLNTQRMKTIAEKELYHAAGCRPASFRTS